MIAERFERSHGLVHPPHVKLFVEILLQPSPSDLSFSASAFSTLGFGLRVLVDCSVRIVSSTALLRCSASISCNRTSSSAGQRLNVVLGREFCRAARAELPISAVKSWRTLNLVPMAYTATRVFGASARRYLHHLRAHGNLILRKCVERVDDYRGDVRGRPWIVFGPFVKMPGASGSSAVCSTCFRARSATIESEKLDRRAVCRVRTISISSCLRSVTGWPFSSVATIVSSMSVVPTAKCRRRSPVAPEPCGPRCTDNANPVMIATYASRTTREFIALTVKQGLQPCNNLFHANSHLLARKSHAAAA